MTRDPFLIHNKKESGEQKVIVEQNHSVSTTLQQSPDHGIMPPVQKALQEITNQTSSRGHD